MGGAMSAPATTVLAATAAASASVGAAAPQSPEARDHHSVAGVLSLAILMSVFCPIFFTLLALACLRLFTPANERNYAIPGLARARDSAASASERSRRGGTSRRAGLDAAAIAALPMVFYKEVRRHRVVEGRDDALECSVCLLEFEDDDALRLLPTCPHVFHPDCIALWLDRHDTCPLCRACVLDEPPQPAPAPAPAQRELELQPVPPLPLQSPESSPAHATVVLIGEPGASSEESDEEVEDEDEDLTTIQRLARDRRAAGRQELPRSNSTGHGGGDSMERFALRLPEHVRTEIIMSHRLRHVTSAVASVRVREGSGIARDAGSTVGGSVRNAVARFMSLFVPGAGWKAEGDDKSGRRDNSSRGAVAEEKRSV